MAICVSYVLLQVPLSIADTPIDVGEQLRMSKPSTVKHAMSGDDVKIHEWEEIPTIL